MLAKSSGGGSHPHGPHRHGRGGPAGAEGAGAPASGGEGGAPGAYSRQPNILLIVVDQLRAPCWFSAAAAASRLMPNIASLREGGVRFESHYTASNDCSPARAALLTGLYTHQTGCMITGGSTLDPGFPTWGTLLREHGYQTAWYGKWHLTHHDNFWSPALDEGALEPYGFSGGTYPSPDGGPGQGWKTDPQIAAQFEDWVAKVPSSQPWSATVSFVNPHDIAWWYRWSDRFEPEASAASLVHTLPPNFQTPAQLRAQRVPQLQLSHLETTAISFGRIPFSGPQTEEAWLPFFDLYLKLAAQVDRHVGRVLKALYARPELAANTVVVFTSDHGEYGGSHGMRGKGGAAYEEGIRVPLIVKDLRGGEALAAAPKRPRTGLTSSVDVAPLLLDIATGSRSWRRDRRYAQIARRHDLLKMLRDPQAPGRSHVLHATDEIVTEFALQPYSVEAPLHLTAIRTPKGKLALYSRWTPGSTRALAEDEEAELYDYGSRAGRLELENRAGLGDALETELRAKLQHAIREELRQRLPRHLHAARRAGIADYFDTAARAVVIAAKRRHRLLERELDGHRLGGGLRAMLRRQYHRAAGAR